MDPNQAYRDMYDALDEQDHETARALALILKRWLASGGFYPASHSELDVNHAINDVLARTSHLSH